MDTFILSDSDQQTILDGLDRLLVEKEGAFKDLGIVAPQLVTGPHPLTERDFGIPQIRELMDRIGGTSPFTPPKGNQNAPT